MNSHQEQTLIKLIESSFPIRNNFPDFIDNEIRKLKGLSTIVGRLQTEVALKTYLKNNKQEYFYKKCVDLLKP